MNNDEEDCFVLYALGPQCVYALMLKEVLSIIDTIILAHRGYTSEIVIWHDIVTEALVDWDADNIDWNHVRRIYRSRGWNVTHVTRQSFMLES